MKKNLVLAFIVIVFSVFVIESCNENGCSKSLVSSYNSHESSKMKDNCMDCHSPNGTAGGCLRVGGTAFDSIPGDSSVQNAQVKLYTEPDGGGELVVTLQVDQSGNFYTTSPVSFGSGLYAAIVSGKGNVRYMPSSTVTGACNSCHGVANAKLWAD
jgi:hypothetical protein